MLFIPHGGPLHSARLCQRRDRFLADVILEDTGEEDVAYCVNPGRMEAFSREGARIWLLPAKVANAGNVGEKGGTKRRLRWTWELIEHEGVLCCANTQRPNNIVGAVLRGRLLPGLDNWIELASERTIKSPKPKSAESAGRCSRHVGYIKDPHAFVRGNQSNDIAPGNAKTVSSVETTDRDATHERNFKEDEEGMIASVWRERWGHTSGRECGEDKQKKALHKKNVWKRLRKTLWTPDAGSISPVTPVSVVTPAPGTPTPLTPPAPTRSASLADAIYLQAEGATGHACKRNKVGEGETEISTTGACEDINIKPLREEGMVRARKRKAGDQEPHTSRLDFWLQEPDGEHYIEVKSCHMVYPDGNGYFPDSVSLRASRHMRELTTLVKEGHRCTVIFVVARGDIRGAVRPSCHHDPSFAHECRAAAAAGVSFRALVISCSLAGLSVEREAPVDLEIYDPRPIALWTAANRPTSGWIRSQTCERVANRPFPHEVRNAKAADQRERLVLQDAPLMQQKTHKTTATIFSSALVSVVSDRIEL